MIRRILTALAIAFSLSACTTLTDLRSGVADFIGPDAADRYARELVRVQADAQALADRLAGVSDAARAAAQDTLGALSDRLGALIAQIRVLDARDRSGLAGPLQDALSVVDELRAALGMAAVDRWRYADLLDPGTPAWIPIGDPS